MTEEMANSTRLEVLPYLMALIIVLVQEWPKRTISCQPILHQFNKVVWSVGLEKAKRTCMSYVDRYYHPRRSDSTSLPRETIIHAEFCQRLAEIWCLFQRSNDARTGKYVQVISDISQQIELNLRGAITGIWP